MSRRDEMLTDALAAFADLGYAGTSIRELGARVGVASSTLYHHFGSKEGILDALVTPYLEATDVLLDAAETGAWTPERLLGAYLELLVDNLRLVRFLDRDLTLLHHSRHGERLRRQTARLRELLAGHGADDGARTRAAAAVGALRRPNLARDVEVDPEVVLQAALAALTSTAVDT